MQSNTTSALLSATSGSSFKILPREVRDLIYHEIWHQTPMLLRKTVDKHGTLPLHLTDMAAHNTKPSEAPRWLLTCKLFLAEGIEQLQRTVKKIDITISTPFSQHGTKIFPWFPFFPFFNTSKHRTLLSYITTISLCLRIEHSNSTPPPGDMSFSRLRVFLRKRKVPLDKLEIVIKECAISREEIGMSVVEGELRRQVEEFAGLWGMRVAYDTNEVEGEEVGALYRKEWVRQFILERR